MSTEQDSFLRISPKELKASVDRSISFFQRYQWFSGAYLEKVKKGRGGRCVFYCDIPAGTGPCAEGPGGKRHFANIASTLIGDVIFANWTDDVLKTQYPKMIQDLFGDLNSILVISSDFKCEPALYDLAVKTTPLHTETSVSAAEGANFNLMFKAYSPTLDSQGNRILLMEAVVNFMLIDLLDLSFSISLKDSAGENVILLPTWFTSKMTSKPALKPLRLSPEKRPEETFVFDVLIKWRDADANRHTNNVAYIRMATDALHAAAKEDALRNVSLLDVESGIHSCRILYMGSTQPTQIINIHVWELTNAMKYSSPLKSKDENAKSAIIVCSFELQGAVVCQAFFKVFDSSKVQ